MRLSLYKPFLILCSLLTFFGCKKNQNNNRTENPPSAQAETGLIYYIPNTAVVLSDDEKLNYVQGTQETQWLANNLAWIVIPTQGYPQLERYANETGELTLAIRADNIQENQLSLTKVKNQKTQDSLVQTSQKNLDNMQQSKSDLSQERKKLDALKKEIQTPENLKAQESLQKRIQKIEEDLEAETKNFINPTDPRSQLDLDQKINITIARIEQQIQSLEKSSASNINVEQQNTYKKAASFFKNLKTKYQTSTQNQKILWGSAFIGTAAIISLVTALSISSEDDKNSSSPKLPGEDLNNQINEPKATDTDSIVKDPNSSESRQDDSSKKDGNQNENIGKKNNEESSEDNQTNNPKTDIAEPTSQDPQKMTLTFNSVKGFIATRDRDAKQGTIELSTALLLNGTFEVTRTGFSLQCSSQCMTIKK